MAHSLTHIDDAYIPPELIGARGVTPEQFEELCRKYRELRLELTSTGELIVMPPTGAETARLNSNLTGQLEAWFRQSRIGVCFSNTGGFTLPNGAIRSPVILTNMGPTLKPASRAVTIVVATLKDGSSSPRLTPVTGC